MKTIFHAESAPVEERAAVETNIPIYVDGHLLVDLAAVRAPELLVSVGLQNPTFHG